MLPLDRLGEEDGGFASCALVVIRSVDRVGSYGHGKISPYRAWLCLQRVGGAYHSPDGLNSVRTFQQHHNYWAGCDMVNEFSKERLGLVDAVETLCFAL